MDRDPLSVLRSGLPKTKKGTKRDKPEKSGDFHNFQKEAKRASGAPLPDGGKDGGDMSTEEANILRKKLRIFVKGDDIPHPLQGSFQDITDMPARLRHNLMECNFKEPSPIQRQTIPVLLAKRDLLGIAPTGSGKTLAFLVPLIMHHFSDPEMRGNGIASLILSPTRELAAQTARCLTLLTDNLKLACTVLSKGTSLGSDFAKVDLLLATPLKLVLLLKKGRVELSGVRFLVCDEVDKLLSDQSMMKQVDEIIAACDNPSRVSAFFSATVGEKVEGLLRSVSSSLLRVTVGDRNSAVSSVKQELMYVGRGSGKLLALRQLLATGGLKPPILVFVSSNKQATQLHKDLIQISTRVDVISADQGHAARAAAVENFRAGKTHVLLATDLLARGMDFVDVATVVNYDFPASSLDYVHRIGRSGRAGRTGHALTFFTEEDTARLRPVANLIRSASNDVPEWMLRTKKPGPRKKGKAKKMSAA